jgi:hypothetical protein
MAARASALRLHAPSRGEDHSDMVPCYDVAGRATHAHRLPPLAFRSPDNGAQEPLMRIQLGPPVASFSVENDGGGAMPLNVARFAIRPHSVP